MKLLDKAIGMAGLSLVLNSIALTIWQYIWVFTSSMDATRQEHMLQFHIGAALTSLGMWCILMVARSMAASGY